MFTKSCRPVQLGKTFPAEKQQGRNPPVSMSCTMEEQSQENRERNEWKLITIDRVGTNESQQSFHSTRINGEPLESQDLRVTSISFECSVLLCWECGGKQGQKQNVQECAAGAGQMQWWWEGLAESCRVSWAGAVEIRWRVEASQR